MPAQFDSQSSARGGVVWSARRRQRAFRCGRWSDRMARCENTRRGVISVSSCTSSASVARTAAASGIMGFELEAVDSDLNFNLST